MKTPSPKIGVMVFDMDGKFIDRAEVVLRYGKSSITLKLNPHLHQYETREFRQGESVIEVSADGLAPDSRAVYISKGGGEYTFVLGKEGLPAFYRGEVKVPFSPNEGLIGIVLRPGSKSEIEEFAQLEALAERYKLKPEQSDPNLARNGVHLYHLPSGTDPKEWEAIRKGLEGQQFVELVGPVLIRPKGNVSLLTDRIIVRFHGHVELKQVDDVAKRFRLEKVRNITYAGNAFEFKVEGPLTLEILKICEQILETGLAVYAEPDLWSTGEDDAVVPTDWQFAEQWDHPIIDTTNAWQVLQDLDATKAFGDPNLVIAVVDSGVDVGHPQFSGNVSNGNPKVLQAYNFVTMVANNNNLVSDHGTCCASAATGATNNASVVAGVNEGTAGIAGNCRLLAIRRGGTEQRYADMYIWAAGFNPNSSTPGFPAPPAIGASVISNSFGFSVGAPISGLMRDTFDFLTTFGRGGKGVLLFFSTANSIPPQLFTLLRPWAAYSKTWAIGASTLANDGVTETNSQYSNFGPGVECCAPSHDQYVPAVGNIPLHNPPANFGVWTGTIRPANPIYNTTLTAAAAAGAGSVTVAAALINNSVIGAGDIIWIGGGATQEVHIITGTNGATGALTLGRPLINAQANGAAVSGTTGFAPGNPQQQNTLNGAIAAGATALTLNNAAGFAIGQAIMIDAPGNAGAEANVITAIAGTTLQLARPVFNNHAAATQVSASTADYKNFFGGTSYSTPVCAGVAALMLTANPSLTWIEVRQLIRNTAIKINPADNNANRIWTDVNGVASNAPGYLGPFFSQTYGYGRIDANLAVTAARDYAADRDIYIRDNMADLGAGPSAGTFWEGVDIWVRNNDPVMDGAAALPANWGTDANTVHENPISGQNNWVYARFQNRGTAASFPFYVRISISHFDGTQFQYPSDWQPTVRPNGVIPNPLTPGTYLIGEALVNSVDAGDDDFVVIQWNQALIPPQTVDVGGTPVTWHPCLLVELSPHDGFAATGPFVWQNNNLAQKNLSIVYPGGGGGAGGSEEDFAAATVIGNQRDRSKYIEIEISRPKIIADSAVYVRFQDEALMRYLEQQAKDQALSNNRGCLNKLFTKAESKVEPDLKVGDHLGNKVIWLANREKVRFKLPNKGYQLMVVGGKSGRLSKGESYRVIVDQYADGGTHTGSTGYVIQS